jgi:hypothetical protein
MTIPPKHITSAKAWDNTFYLGDYAYPLRIPAQRNGHNFTDFSKKEAENMVREIKKHIGEPVYVYGGGGNETWLVELNGVKLEPQDRVYAPKSPYSLAKEIPKNAKIVKVEDNRIIFREVPCNDYIVEVDLKIPDDCDLAQYSKDNHFRPHLGSWRIAFLKPEYLSKMLRV